MRNPLQDQLLKAGLVKKAQVDKVAREQVKHRDGKAPPAPTESQREAERVLAERAERDRALAAERNAQSREAERRAQARQIVATHQVPRKGDIEYRFTDGDRITSLLVDATLRTHLASGLLVIAKHGDGYALLPRVAAQKVRERDASLIVLDHGAGKAADIDDADDPYKDFVVPDDLIW